MTSEFWRALDDLVTACPARIDRPKGSAHPRYPDVIYPLDYGYLDGTASGDGVGIDVWIGTLPDRHVTAIICSVDLDKRDAELKLLVGCTPAEAQTIERFHNDGSQAALLVERPVIKA